MKIQVYEHLAQNSKPLKLWLLLKFQEGLEGSNWCTVSMKITRKKEKKI
jgi:hypothetical protein